MGDVDFLGLCVDLLAYTVMINPGIRSSFFHPPYVQKNYDFLALKNGFLLYTKNA